MFIYFNKALRTVLLLSAILVLIFQNQADLFAAQSRLQVVTTKTFFSDLVRQIGGERVRARAIASPKFNIHFIQPKPSDVAAVAKADLYVFSGLDLEAWSDPLVEAAGKPDLFRGGSRSLDMSEGIRLLNIPTGSISRSQGDIHLFGNPHYTMDPENARVMAATVAKKLIEIDPEGAEHYQDRKKVFLETLDKKIAEWRALSAHCRGKEIYAYHENTAYFADFLGLRSELFLEPKPGIPPTPRQLELLERHAAAGQVKAIVAATYESRNVTQALSERIKAPVVIIIQNPAEIPGTEDIFSFYDYNIRQLSEAIK